MKIFCDECHKIIWPKRPAMKVTPDDLINNKVKRFHLDCWISIAPKDELLAVSKKFREDMEKRQNGQ